MNCVIIYTLLYYWLLSQLCGGEGQRDRTLTGVRVDFC